MNRKSASVVVIGGVIIGSFVAYFLRKEGFQGSVTAVEKDSTYQFSSTALSAASIRTQFGCPFNIEMSLFSANIIKNAKEYFGEDADIGFREYGYLMLGSRDTAETQRRNALMQRKHGASRSEEHTSELQSLMRISYAVFCLKKKTQKIHKE